MAPEVLRNEPANEKYVIRGWYILECNNVEASIDYNTVSCLQV